MAQRKALGCAAQELQMNEPFHMRGLMEEMGLRQKRYGAADIFLLWMRFWHFGFRIACEWAKIQSAAFGFFPSRDKR